MAMIGMRIDKVKGLFFDSKKVLAATTKAERRVLSKFGAFVRRAAKSSIRKRKRASEPGRPPSSHEGTLKRFIYFVYEPNRHNVVIGPVRLSGKRLSGDGAPMMPSKTTPDVLEHGGNVQIVEYQRDYTPRGRRMVEARGRDPDAWYRMGKKRLWHKKGQPLRIRAKRKRVIKVSPRPFMGPAFEKEKPKLPAMWRDSIRA